MILVILNGIIQFLIPWLYHILTTNVNPKSFLQQETDHEIDCLCESFFILRAEIEYYVHRAFCSRNGGQTG